MGDSVPISITDARRTVIEHTHLLATEKVNLFDSLNRVLSKDCTSDIDVSPFDDTALDGYALISNDLNDAAIDNPILLKCVGHIGAGFCYNKEVKQGECVRIMTGAPIPKGANTIVQIEKVTYENDGLIGDFIRFTEPQKPGANIRIAGEEAKKGDVVMEKGDVISPAGVGLLASCGNLEVEVYKRPKVGIISTGSELINARDIPQPGQIRDSNIWSLQAMVLAAGGIPKPYPYVSDNEESIKQLFIQASKECDVVVSSGGACHGDYDLTPKIMNEIGEVYFHQIDMKPGKSQPFGIINDALIFALAGNPGAAYVGFEMLVRPALLYMQGYKKLNRPTVFAKAKHDFEKKANRVRLQRGRVSKNEKGEFEVEILGNQSSALLGSFQTSNCLIVVRNKDFGFKTGEDLMCILTGINEWNY